MSKSNIYIIDDAPVILTLYSSMLEHEDYNIFTYTSPNKFLREYDDSIPSCAIIDINLGEIDGLSLFKIMKSFDMFLPSIFISGNRDLDYISQLFREGAFDFVEKPYMKADLLLEIVDKALEYDKKESAKRKELSECKDLIGRLTDRERNVLNLLAIGNSAKVIAKELNISYRTVETHITNIKTKTQLDTVKLLGKLIYLKIHG